MTKLIIGFFLIGIIGFLVLCYKGWKMEKTGAEEVAIKLLLEAGCVIEKNRWHLYRSGAGDYRLLHFSERSDMLRDDEESYVDIADAVSKFVQKTGL